MIDARLPIERSRLAFASGTGVPPVDGRDGRPTVLPVPWGPPTSRPGVALIAVLWALMLAGLILLGVQQAARITTAVGYNDLASTQAHWLARAGVEQAIAELAFTDPGVSSMLDYWHDDPASFEAVPLGAGSFSVLAPQPPERTAPGPRFGLEDHAARININIADRDALDRLELLDDGQIDAILDWRDTSEEVRPGGAGRAYYQRLPYPYEIRNGPLHTLKELRLIRGIDDATYFGEGSPATAIHFPGADAAAPVPGQPDDTRALGLARLATVHSYTPNRTALGDRRVNVNEANAATLQSRLRFSAPLAEAVVEAREFDSLMDLLDVQPDSTDPPSPSGAGGEDDEDTVTEITLDWLAANLDELTLTDDDRLPGRINLNTAPRPVLLTLPAVTPAVADDIIAHRHGAGGPFYSVGELLNVREVDEDAFRAIAERVAVTSAVFQITSVGATERGIRQQIVAVVDRDASGEFQILYWYQSE